MKSKKKPKKKGKTMTAQKQPVKDAEKHAVKESEKEPKKPSFPVTTESLDRIAANLKALPNMFHVGEVFEDEASHLRAENG